MTTLRPVAKVFSFKGINFLLTFLTLAAGSFSCCDAEWRQFLRGDILVGHHVGTSNFKPALHGIVLARNQLDDELWLTACGMITSLVLVQVIAYYAMFYLSHICIVERIGRIIADARLETLCGGEVHILRIGHWRTVYEEIIGESLVEMLIDLCTPYAIAIALHSLGLGQDFCG